MTKNSLLTYVVNISLIACCLAGGQLSAQTTGSKSINDELSPIDGIALTGYIGEKLNESTDNRILAQDADRLIAVFKPENRNETTQWQSEFWGKWITSAELAYQYKPTPELKKVLDHAVSGLLATQTPDGYIGNYAVGHRLENWDIWGRKYCILGLLGYYKITADKKSLKGAIGIADNLINDLHKTDGLIINKGNYKGMAASSVLEPVCLLYRYTQNKKYLDFALEIVRQWELPNGPQLISKAKVNVGERFPQFSSWYGPDHGQKAYEMMSCYEGLLELYRLTGNPSYKKAVEDTWQNIRAEEINIAGSGASMEMWFNGRAVQNIPITHYQETCVTVTWLKLTNQLLRLTGEAKYADEAERTYYNALLGAMRANGAVWAKYTPLNGQRLPGSEQCGMGLNCCEASGPRGLFNMPMHMLMATSGGFQVNYFAQGAFKLKSPLGRNVQFDQITDYPKSGAVNFVVKLEKPEDFEIGIRIPGWSKENKVTVNGQVLDGLNPGAYATIKRRWKTGDRVSLELDMRGRVVQTGKNLVSAAIMCGPVVLARDSRFGGVGIETVVKPVTDKDGYIMLSNVVSKNEDPLIICKASFIPESATEKAKGSEDITLVDYASAGNGKTDSFFKVWLPQPITIKEK
jgi:DUF1680 family protein